MVTDTVLVVGMHVVRMLVIPMVVVVIAVIVRMASAIGVVVETSHEWSPIGDRTLPDYVPASGGGLCHLNRGRQICCI